MTPLQELLGTSASHWNMKWQLGTDGAEVSSLNPVPFLQVTCEEGKEGKNNCFYSVLEIKDVSWKSSRFL